MEKVMFCQWNPEAAAIIEKNPEDALISADFILENRENKVFDFEPIKSLINLAIVQPPTWDNLIKYLGYLKISFIYIPNLVFQVITLHRSRLHL